MTGGSSNPAQQPIYDLKAATGFPAPPEKAPDWLLVVPEPTKTEVAEAKKLSDAMFDAKVYDGQHVRTVVAS